MIPELVIQEIEDVLEKGCEDSTFGEDIAKIWSNMQLHAPNIYQRLHEFFDLRSEYYDDDGTLDEPVKVHERALKKITRQETAALVKMAFDLGLITGISLRSDSSV